MQNNNKINFKFVGEISERIKDSNNLQFGAPSTKKITINNCSELITEIFFTRNIWSQKAKEQNQIVIDLFKDTDNEKTTPVQIITNKEKKDLDYYETKFTENMFATNFNLTESIKIKLPINSYLTDMHISNRTQGVSERAKHASSIHNMGCIYCVRSLKTGEIKKQVVIKNIINAYEIDYENNTATAILDVTYAEKLWKEGGVMQFTDRLMELKGSDYVIVSKLLVHSRFNQKYKKDNSLDKISLETLAKRADIDLFDLKHGKRNREKVIAAIEKAIEKKIICDEYNFRLYFTLSPKSKDNVKYSVSEIKSMIQTGLISEEQKLTTDLFKRICLNYTPYIPVVTEEYGKSTRKNKSAIKKKYKVK